MQLLSSATRLLVTLAVSHFATAVPHPGSVTKELTARQQVRVSWWLCPLNIYIYVIKGDLTVCIDGLGDPTGCFDLQVTDRNCIDFTGTLSDAISNIIIPNGFVCFFSPYVLCFCGLIIGRDLICEYSGKLAATLETQEVTRIRWACPRALGI